MNEYWPVVEDDPRRVAPPGQLPGDPQFEDEDFPADWEGDDNEI